jgi:hypothetical protein
MPPWRRSCQERGIPGSSAAKVTLPMQCDPPLTMAALRAPVSASQLYQRALDRQRGLSGMPSFPWPPGLAPEMGRFAESKRLVLVH